MEFGLRDVGSGRIPVFLTQLVDIMPRSTNTSSRHVSIVSTQGIASPEADVEPYLAAHSNDDDDEDILRDFGADLQQSAAGTTASNSPNSNDDTGEDAPSTQLLSEATGLAQPLHPPASTQIADLRSTDDSVAALNSVLSPGLKEKVKSAVPLPSKAERARHRNEQNRNLPTTHGKLKRPRYAGNASSSPRRNDAPSSPEKAPLSAQPPRSTRDEEHEGGSGLSRATRKQQAELERAEPGQAEVEAPKRKRGRPRKEPQAPAVPSPKRQKTATANTTRRRSSRGAGQEVSGSQEAQETASQDENSTINADSTAATPHAIANAASRPRNRPPESQLVQEVEDSEESEEWSGDEQHGHEENPILDETSAVESRDEDFQGSSLEDLMAMLRHIRTDLRGALKIREQRKLYGLKRRTDSASSLVRIGCGLISKLQKRKSNPVEVTDAEKEEIREEIASLECDVNELDLENKADRRKFLFEDLYVFVFPCLLRALCKIVEFCVERVARKDDDHPMPTPFLKAIFDFTAAIINLSDRVRQSKVKVNPALNIVRPCRNYIVAPLKRFHDILGQQLRSQIQEEARAETRRLESRRQKRADEHWAREAEERAVRSQLKEDWRLLHIDRKQAEPDFRFWHRLDWVPPGSPEREHVARHSDVDANGEPFDRVDAFHHRRSHGQRRRQTAELALEIVGPDWTDGECLALMESLAEYTAKDYKNPRYMVYRNIIYRHCRPGGALNRFNVTEITQKARYLKRMLEDRDWTEKIPVFY